MATRVRPVIVSGTSVRPRRVGAPAAMVEDDPENPVEYSPQAYRNGILTYLPLGRHTIAAGTTVTTQIIRPDYPMIPQKLFCPSTVVGLFITAVNISGSNMLANNEPMPIEIYSEVSTSPQIEWYTIQTGPGVRFEVFNPTGTDLEFTGAIYGTAVRQ